MATMTLRMTDMCPANNHFTLTATGDISFSTRYEVGEFTAPVTDEEKAVFLKLLVRFAKIGRTNSQVRTALTAGVVVAI